MIPKSVILCCLLLCNVSDADGVFTPTNHKNPCIEISEVNNTESNINGNFSWNAGTKHIIECTVINSTKEEHLFCSDPSKNPVKGGRKERIFLQSYLTLTNTGYIETALRISFNPTTTEDSGIWECHSTNGYLNETFSICVLDKLQFVNTISNYSTRQGRSTSLKCKANGEPGPYFQWYRNEEIITDDYKAKYKISTKFSTKYSISTLTITNITKKDKGLYVCKAIQQNPSVGSKCTYMDSKNFTLNVLHAPTFNTGNSDPIIVYSLPGESEHIRCGADGYPKPIYTWFKHINGSNSLNVAINKADLNLTIDETSFGDNYICRAVNSQGEASKTYIVAKMLKPNNPDNIILNSNGTDNIVTLNWEEDIKYPIQGVDIEYLNGECKTNVYNIWNSAASINLKVNEEQYKYNNSLSVSLSNLNEDNLQCFRFRVTNKAGNSPWSDPIAVYGVPMELLRRQTVTSIWRNVSEQDIFLIEQAILSASTCVGFFNLIITYILSYFY